MSKMEYNKGTLTLVSSDPDTFIQQWFEGESVPCPPTPEDRLWEFDEMKFDKRHSFEVLNDCVYHVSFDVEGGELDQINNLEQVGRIEWKFETYHYNGGGLWTELVADKLRNMPTREVE